MRSRPLTSDCTHPPGQTRTAEDTILTLGVCRSAAVMNPPTLPVSWRVRKGGGDSSGYTSKPETRQHNRREYRGSGSSLSRYSRLLCCLVSAQNYNDLSAPPTEDYLASQHRISCFYHISTIFSPCYLGENTCCKLKLLILF